MASPHIATSIIKMASVSLNFSGIQHNNKLTTASKTRIRILWCPKSLSVHFKVKIQAGQPFLIPRASKSGSFTHKGARFILSTSAEPSFPGLP